ncbi:UvrD-helicase domain-containing protein [bacterium]|nr:UvrD-helicase domain-containing protein [bacterium]
MRRDPADQDVRLRAAQTIDRNIFLDAGAGCGKTQALTARYLSLLQAGVDIADIVAVTFTNKAARDMKARLRRECEREALATDDAETAALWQHRARQLENAPISTIHSFCTSLLRRYALRAGLDPGFAVMDEVQHSLLLQETLRRSLLDRLDADEPSAATAVAALGLQGALEAVRKLVRAREAWQAELEAPPTAADLLARWAAEQDNITRERLNLLVMSPAWMRHAATLREHRGSDSQDRLEGLRVDLLALIGGAENRAAALPDRLACLARISTLGNVPGKGQGWSEGEMAAVAEACRQFKNKGKEPADSIGDLCSDDDADPTPAAELTAAVYLEAHHALNAFQQAKAEEARLDYEDLQVLVRDLLATNARVRRDCHERYQHVLVDEFQDTNSLQRDLLWLVASGEPQLQPPPAAPLLPPPGKLFVVGDAKQSIYRFRDADVTVFDAVRRDFGATEGSERERLAVTFRSHPHLVDLHNRLFADPRLMGPDHEGREPYEAFYEPLQAHRDAPEDDVCCDIVLARADAATNAEERREAEAAALAAWLKENLGKLQVYERDDDGEERARPCQLRDIALLFRATTSIRLYERALRLAGLAYHTSAGRGFFTRQEVRDLTNLLAALENWRDEIALAGVLRSPLFGLSDETLFWLKQGSDTLAEGLKLVAEGRHPQQDALAAGEATHAAFAWEQFRTLRRLKNRLPLSALLSETVRRTGYTAAVAGLYDGDQQIGNVRKLIEIAAGFEAAGNYSLRDFIDVLRDLVTTEERMAQAPVVEEQADCLKLMTVHAAKGLEWPIVIVPDLAHDGGGRGSAVRTHRRFGLIACPEVGGKRPWPPVARLMAELDQAEDLAERKRLLYVALTRCRDRLVLSTALGHRSAEGWYEWLAGAMDLDPEAGTCAMPGVRVHVMATDELTGSHSRGPTTPALPPADAPEVLRRLVPQPLAHAAVQRFTVTALSAYRRCPRYYYLRYLAGLADDRGLGATAVQERSLPATERGDIMHRALELIGRDGPPEAADALRQALGWRMVADDDRQEMLDRLRWYLAQPVYADRVAVAAGLRSEVPVAFALQGALVEGKIDAVAETGQALCALDYKTGYETEGEADADHVFQLGLYCAGLRSFGRAVGAALIAYLDRAQIVPLTEEETAQAERDAAAAIAGIHAGQFDCRCTESCERCGLRWACAEGSVPGGTAGPGGG